MRPRLVAALIVHNEANRYLETVLGDLNAYCDRICVLDDGSTDATPDICLAFPRVHFVRNPASLFGQSETILRQQLWTIATSAEPDWILAIDADEVLEDRFKREQDRYLNQVTHPLIGVQVYEFWGSTSDYRVDKFWNPDGKYQAMFIRYVPGFPYRWTNRALHCGRLPANAPGPVLLDGLRCKHFGYANPADQQRKHDLYIQRDPHGYYCSRAHYDSILDAPHTIRLKRWEE